MHWQAYQFVYLVKFYFPDFFVDGSVLEIESHSVNGSIRKLFSTDVYVGLDLSTGPGVDVVQSGHEYKFNVCFDVTISCECFEHNPHYAQTFTNMVNLTKESGIVIFTCATSGRPEHGTSKTEPSLSPGTSSLNWDYYLNLTEEHFSEHCSDLSISYFFVNKFSNDLYFVGTKSEKLARKLELVIPQLGILFSQFELISADINNTFKCLPLISECLASPKLLFDIYQRLKSNNLVQNIYFRSLHENSLKFMPDSPELNFIEAEKYAVSGNKNFALFFAKLAKDNSIHPFFINYYAESLANVGRFGDAIEQLKSIVDFEKMHNLVWKLADFSFRVNEFQSALNFIDSALNMCQSRPFICTLK
jgi:SAM-dependent methyltransferase